MNTILQKRIEEAADEYIETAIDSGENNFVDEGGMPLFDDDYVKATYIEAATIALQNQWISIEEALPDDDENVLLIFDDGHIIVAYHSGNYWWWCDGFVCGTKTNGQPMYSSSQKVNDKPTHWMPIPEMKGGEK